MTTIFIDGHTIETRPDQNLLQACLSAGVDVPYFCWHPDLGSVGACRQCAVKQYSSPDDKTGRIVMACMTPVSEGMRIAVAEPESHEFRGSVIEWLMTNHPHDCPVCEEGGECHLQDMTVMTGHNSRRYRFRKRTHRNQDLGPFIKHEMNRCIACYRCVRFYRDYAGGEDLAAFASHNNVYFGRDTDGVLESDFSGNLVEVCPTGVFTDKPFSAQYSRKWDMRGAPSVCMHCAAGCNILVNERAGKVRRVLNRYNGEVNRYFLCDRGRFGYGHVNAPDRLRSAQRRDGAEMPHPISGPEALLRLGNLLRGGDVYGIGSPRASLEANFALRHLVGESRFHSGVGGREQALLDQAALLLRESGGSVASLHDAERSDAVLVLGEDVCKTAPRLGLALRQASRQRSFATAAAGRVPLWLDNAVRGIGTGLLSPIYVATALPTDLDPLAIPLRGSPEAIARFAQAVAHRIDPECPAGAEPPGPLAAQVEPVAEALLGAARPLVASGLQAGSIALLQAAGNLMRALRRRGRTPRLALSLPDCNSLGMAMLGGGALEDVLQAARDGQVRTLVVLENDLFRRLPAAVVQPAFGRVPNLVVLDHLRSPTMQAAHLLLPVAAFSETSGTVVSSEGRAQRFFQVAQPPLPTTCSWRWLRDAALEAGRNQDFSWRDLDDVVAALGQAFPALRRVRDAAPAADFRINGSALRSQTHRYSGRTAIRSHVSVRDAKPEPHPDSPLATTMEGYHGPAQPASTLPYLWAPGWNSGQSVGKFQAETGGPMRGGDPGVRLFDGLAEPGGPYRLPDFAPQLPAGETMLLPQARLFGSEELSDRSAPIAERIEAPVLRLPPQAAARFPQSRACLSLFGESHVVTVVPDDRLPPGTASFPAHAAPLSAFALPEQVSLDVCEAVS